MNASLTVKLGQHALSARGRNGWFAADHIDIVDYSNTYSAETVDTIRLSVSSSRPSNEEPIILRLSPEEASQLGEALYEASRWKRSL